jgi:hypothetical protein
MGGAAVQPVVGMTDAGHFEIQLSFPQDVRLAATVRALAVHAARFAGCGDAQAEEFGRSVEEVARTCLADSTSDRDVPVVVRRMSGPLEVLIDTQLVSLDL